MGRCSPLKNHHDLRMPRELAVELIELLAGARIHHARQRQVLALTRRPHFHGRAIEVGDVAQHDIEHQLREPVFGAAHDLDRERTWKLEQRFGHGLFHRSNMGADMSRASAGASATGDTCTRGSAGAEAPALARDMSAPIRSEEHTSELQSLAYLVCRLLLE